MAASAGDSLRLETLAPARVAAGEAVPVTLRVTNVAEEAVTLYLQGREIAFDMVVEAPDGTVVWRRLEGAVIPAILQIRTLAPGETLELRGSWPQRTGAGDPVPPGRYVVRGEILTDGEPLVTPPDTVVVEAL